MNLTLGNKTWKLIEVKENVTSDKWLLIGVKDGIRVQIGDFSDYLRADLVTHALRMLNTFDTLELIRY